MNNGSDGPVTSVWPPIAAGGVARDYNVVIFDGPGQQSMLFDRGVPFRHDWEQVITPVVDFLLGRSDVDPKQIVLYGISQAGVLGTPRAGVRAPHCRGDRGSRRVRRLRAVGESRAA